MPATQPSPVLKISLDVGTPSTSPWPALATPSMTEEENDTTLGTNNAQSSQISCLVCGDRATGKHYNALTCDGCKGFFRRTVRKHHSYACRFQRKCVVDKDHRNMCRRCRFDKCLHHGMRREAVQMERDSISTTCRRRASSSITLQTSANGSRKASSLSASGSSLLLPHNPATTHDNGPSMDVNDGSTKRVGYAENLILKLVNAEARMRQIRASVITRTVDAYRTATTGDVTESMHQQLVLMVEWAKQLEQFNCLPMPAKIGLLRHFSAQHLVICAAFRSIAVADAVWLTNESYVPRDAPKIPDVNRVAARVLDHVAAPMRQLHLDEPEYVALKAVAFFDPGMRGRREKPPSVYNVLYCSVAKGTEESADGIESARADMLNALDYYVGKMSPRREMPLRLANLLLLLPPITAIARDLAEEAQLAKLFGLANIDDLMEELLLPEKSDNNTYSHLKTSVGSDIGCYATLSGHSPTNSIVVNTTTATIGRTPHYQYSSATDPYSIIEALQRNGIIAPTPIYPQIPAGTAVNDASCHEHATGAVGIQNQQHLHAQRQPLQSSAPTTGERKPKDRQG